MIKIAAISLTMLVLPHAGMAAPCEEFTIVNAGWMEVMSMVSEYDSGTPLDHEQRRNLSAAISAQLDRSEALPWSFDDVGDERGMEIATGLVTSVKSLYRPIGDFHDNDEALAQSLDEIAQALDAIGEYCAKK